MSMDASSLPVCLLTVEGQGLNETQLHDYLQFSIRNQIAGVPGATVPPPYGGKYRQIMVYVDPLKLQAHQLSPMDVVRATDESNLILPAGDVRIGPMDYNIYTNAQVPNAKALNDIPLKTEGEKSVFVSDVGKAVDGSALQYNIVRVNGQRSVYVPILKQGGDTNTIAVVDGIKKRDQDSARYSVAIEDARGVRPIAFCEAGDFDRVARGRRGTVADGADDIDFSGEPARHGGGISFHSAFGDGGVFSAPFGERDDQQHGAERPGAGIFAVDR